MRVSILLSLLSLCATNVFAFPEFRHSDDKAAELDNLLEHIKELQLSALEEESAKLKQRGITSTCNIGNVAIRRE